MRRQGTCVRARIVSPNACDYGAVGAALFDMVNVHFRRGAEFGAPLKVASTPAAAPRPLLAICDAGLRAERTPRKRETGGSSPPASTKDNALVAKRQTQPPQKRPPSRHGGSTPPGCTILVCARPPMRRALASPSGQGIGLTHRHCQVRVLERAPSLPLSGAERPADKRKTAVRYRAGEPQKEMTMMTRIKGRGSPRARRHWTWSVQA